MSANVDPGSFRDRSARVFYSEGQILRALSAQALGNWNRLSETSFYSHFSKMGALVRTERIPEPPPQGSAPSGQWVAFLRHERLPFVSYPYEWCFGMLRDAALLQLDLLLSALAEGMILKDATAFNVQWRGSRPVFIDIASFETLAAGQPWTGYSQFCRSFLYPLLLEAYRGVPFRPWLRGALEGIEPGQCWRLMSVRDLLRPGVLSHVYLQARAQARYGSTQRDVRAELRDAGFNPTLIAANASGLRRLVASLKPTSAESAWSEYAERNTYDDADSDRKRKFVLSIASARRRSLAWDLGCNTGVFSRILGDHTDSVVALDSDAEAIERLYRTLKKEGNSVILPLVSDLADPSPSLGWRGRERPHLPDRGRPELVLCLALVHHAVITANIPLDEFLEWLSSLGSELIVEFVTREDPMVRQLLRNKVDQYQDYDLANFERCMSQHFVVQRTETLGSGTRVLYHAHPRQQRALGRE